MRSQAAYGSGRHGVAGGPRRAVLAAEARPHPSEQHVISLTDTDRQTDTRGRSETREAGAVADRKAPPSAHAMTDHKLRMSHGIEQEGPASMREGSIVTQRLHSRLQGLNTFSHITIPCGNPDGLMNELKTWDGTDK